ncbi:MAG: hypothetical protein J5706_02415 [Elusimicrobiales bacterium]|nr:hypothetical protein [Elusimicrobiales bacterium]
MNVLNLSLNLAGLIIQQKNVSIWTNSKDNPKEVLCTPWGDTKAGQNKILKGIGNALGLNAAIMKARIEDTSQLMKYPCEDGVEITNHQVQNPVRITIELTMPAYFYGPIVKELKKYKQEGTFLSVHVHDSGNSTFAEIAEFIGGEEGIYSNMVVKDIPHDETPERADRITYNITLEQCLLVRNEAKPQTAEAADSSTTDTGNKTAEAAQ